MQIASFSPKVIVLRARRACVFAPPPAFKTIRSATILSILKLAAKPPEERNSFLFEPPPSLPLWLTIASCSVVSSEPQCYVLCARITLTRSIHRVYISKNRAQRETRGGKRSLSVAIIDYEFYTFDLIEIRVRNLLQFWPAWDSRSNFCFFLHCILFITKVVTATLFLYNFRIRFHWTFDLSQL